MIAQNGEKFLSFSAGFCQYKTEGSSAVHIVCRIAIEPYCIAVVGADTACRVNVDIGFHSFTDRVVISRNPHGEGSAVIQKYLTFVHFFGCPVGFAVDCNGGELFDRVTVSLRCFTDGGFVRWICILYRCIIFDGRRNRRTSVRGISCSGGRRSNRRSSRCSGRCAA